MSLIVRLCSLDDTQTLAKFISSIIKKRNVILLKGELGSGKTTFAQFFIGNFVKNAVISSPTFGIVNVYNGQECELWHYDLYRVKNQGELFELGLDDALNSAITLIEWPEIIEDVISNDGIILSFCRNDNEIREVEIVLLGGMMTKIDKIKECMEGINGK